MAAVRVRLLFDYPPPRQPAARMCWLFLQLDQCRVVADLESTIRHRFGFSSRTLLHLYLDGYLLPPSESVYLVRDNDSIRVKQEEVIMDNGLVYGDSPEHSRPRKRQRHRLVGEEWPGNVEREKKKRRKATKVNNEQLHNSVSEHSSGVWAEGSKKRKKEVAAEGEKCEVQKKHCKKKRDKSIKDQITGDKSTKNGTSGKPSPKPTATASPSKPAKSMMATKTTPVQKKGKADVPNCDSSSNSSDRSPVLQQKRNTVKALGTKGLARKGDPGIQNAVKMAASSTPAKVSDDSSASDSSDSDTSVQKPGAQLLAAKQNKNGDVIKSTKLSISGSSDSKDPEVVKVGKLERAPTVLDTQTDKSRHIPLPSPSAPRADQTGNGYFGRGNGRGRGGGFSWAGPGSSQQRGVCRGRGRGAAAFYYNYEANQDPKPGHLNEAMTDKSVAKNCPEVPKRDYSSLPLLAAAPQVGDRIAFKMLELTENYTPEVSEYKEGRIMSYNSAIRQVELEVVHTPKGFKEPGKFDLVYENEAGEEVVEYAVSRDSRIAENWDSLIEPRLIVECAVRVPVT
ncbi:coilin isoform X1 [Callorhinchus milii]|uniref:Coilin n=1 Tax=Callorhinchus milii TaxID=7868 RepID=V9KN87_CALMI|nr:coilin isoform X1 [Callorhinchus milii]|eukprot:gi/632985671/ref/XP_007909814.1/ PREDICTED: coilin isoform X1 [Callorhinchus milii]